jgi:hypothetical protein
LTEQGFDPLQDKIFSHLLDLTILNSFILSCEKVASLRIMMEHAERDRTPALSTTIACLEGGSGHWPTSSANRILCRVCYARGKKRSIMTKCMKCRVGLCIFGCFVDYHKKVRLS